MSTSRRFTSLGGGSGKTPEKSNFANTCNLLSRYMKEKGSLRDFNLEIDGKIECLESIMKSGSTHAASASTTKNLSIQIQKSAQPSADFSPPLAGPDSPIIKVEDTTSNKASTSKEATAAEPKSAQLTIFYAGRILVFDNCPADKAQELVIFARKGSPQTSGGIVANILPEKTNSDDAMVPESSSRDDLPPKPRTHNVTGMEKTRSEAVDLEKAVGISSNTCKEIFTNGSGGVGFSSKVEDPPRPTPSREANISDLPIARRASVHRFLEKRKERAAARGPYHIQEPPQPLSSSSSKDDEHLDLKL